MSATETFTTDIRVRYVETDQMGFVHHSNYLNWFEVARTEFLRLSNLSYRDFEETGVIMPVTACTLQYKKPAKYEDLVQVTTWIESYSKVRMTFAYEVTRDGELLVTGTTDLAFITREGSPVRLNKTHPEYHEWIVSKMRKDS